MPRLLFTKTGESVWMSHLDLMRLFQRAFKRAGMPLTHTQGYNPRPSVSIALPLSVGMESECELLDFDLEGEGVSCEAITARLNQVLVPGVQVLQTYNDGRKIKEIALLECMLTLEYDRIVTEQDAQNIAQLFSRESIVVEKKGKNGVVDQDIRPMIHTLLVTWDDAATIRIRAIVCCQNPSLNPMQLAAAIERYLPDLRPDHVRYRRLRLLDAKEKTFR